MSKESPGKVRQRLRRIGARRRKHRDQEERLHADTIEGLELAKGVIPTSEAAGLVGLTRSTVYEVYRGGRKARKARQQD